MKTIYLDIFSGISGDMFLGALIDLGADFHQIEQGLRTLGLEEYHLHISRQARSGIEGIKFDVHLESEHHHHEHGHEHEHAHGHHELRSGAAVPAASAGVSPASTNAGETPLAAGGTPAPLGRKPTHHAHEHGSHHHHANMGETTHHTHEEHPGARTFSEIRQLILAARLTEWVKQKSVAVFQRIAVAEGKIHGRPPEQVHFHEVGAIDSIVDIVGGCIALELLGKPRLLAAAVVEGTGWLDCAHGRFPIPAPATLEILGARSIPLGQCEEPHELVTPTGAALLAELVESFGPMQDFAPVKIGYGIGTRENKTRPNVLRAVLGETQANATHDWETDTIAVLETNLDDINAEILGGFIGKAIASGALDVFHTPIQMKKNRPGVLLTVLCAEREADRFTELLLRETSAFGVRRHTMERRKLKREAVTVKTPYGEAVMKLGRLDGQIIQAAPEFESCKMLAENGDMPLKAVYEAAVGAWIVAKSASKELAGEKRY